MKKKKDLLILVNEKDEVLGYKEKIKCHLGKGIKHRAFSVFLFDNQGRLLIQKRAQGKMLWPGFWANTCCSHPRRGEGYIEAGERRVQEELGIKASLRFLFKFSYQACYKDIGSENELCAVLVGKYQGDEIKPDPQEVAEWKFVDFKKLQEDIKKNPQKYAPWFKIEMKKIKNFL